MFSVNKSPSKIVSPIVWFEVCLLLLLAVCHQLRMVHCQQQGLFGRYGDTIVFADHDHENSVIKHQTKGDLVVFGHGIDGGGLIFKEQDGWFTKGDLIILGHHGGDIIKTGGRQDDMIVMRHDEESDHGDHYEHYDDYHGYEHYGYEHHGYEHEDDYGYDHYGYRR